MIRVTNTQLQRTSIDVLGAARARLQQSQQVAMTGKRVANPSDDPAAAARAQAVQALLDAASAHRDTISLGLSRLQTAEQALADSGNQLTRAKEIALQMANGTMTAAQRTQAASEVAQIKQTLIDRIDTKDGNEYVFADVNTHTPPYDAAAGGFTYDPNTYSSVRQIEIGPGEKGEIGASAAKAFAQRSADPGSVDVVGALQSLQDHLSGNDVAGLRQDVDTIGTAFDQVLAERTAVGTRIDRLHDADDAAQQSSTVYTTLQSDLVDADASRAFSDLNLAQTQMQAAVTVASRILGPSLLDALK